MMTSKILIEFYRWIRQCGNDAVGGNVLTFDPCCPILSISH